MPSLSDKLQKLLEHRGITPAELSRASGVPQARISEIVSGKTQNPQLKTLQKLSEALNVNLSFDIPKIADTYVMTPDQNYASGLISPEDQELIRRFRKLNDRHQQSIMEMIEAYEYLSEGKQRVSSGSAASGSVVQNLRRRSTD